MLAVLVVHVVDDASHECVLDAAHADCVGCMVGAGDGMAYTWYLQAGKRQAHNTQVHTPPSVCVGFIRHTRRHLNDWHGTLDTHHHYNAYDGVLKDPSTTHTLVDLSRCLLVRMCDAQSTRSKAGWY